MRNRKLKVMIRKCILTGVLTVGALTLSSCGNKYERDENTIKMFTYQTDIDGDLKKYAEEFEKKNPGYTIEVETEYQAYEQRVLLDLAAGVSTDILQVNECIPRDLYDYNLVSLGKKEDLDKKYRYLEGGTIEGEVYTIPLGVSVEGGVLYDKTVLAQAGITELPKTPEELTEAIKKVSETTKAIPLYTCDNEQQRMAGWNTLATSVKADTNAEKEYMALKNPFDEDTVFAKTYGVLYEAVKNDFTEVNKGMDNNWAEAQKKLKNHEIGMIVVPADDAEEFFMEHSEEYGYQPFSAEDGGYYLQMKPQPGLGISKACKNQDLAKKWIDYLYNETDYLEKCNCTYMRQDKEDSKLTDYLKGQGMTLMEPATYTQKEITEYEEKVTNSEISVDSGYLGWYLIDLATAKEDPKNFKEICDSWNESWNKTQNK